DAELLPQIVSRHLKNVEAKKYQAIAKDLHVSLEEIVASIKLLGRLDPKPGRGFSGEEPQYITPDVYIHKIGENYVTVLNDDGLSKLRISQHYRIAFLKPLNRRDVTEDIGMHESTVSRVSTNKYVHTPQGIYELKFFFNSSISRVGCEDIASEAVKNQIKHIVSGEPGDKPYSDQKIVEILRTQNVHIARRTVAKYREEPG